MGLWYSKDFGFELIAYADGDHAGCNDDFKSTSEGIQFLGDKLVSWSTDRDDLGKMKPKADIEDSQSIPSKSDLDNLFGPLYEEYYKMSSQEVFDDSAANTTDNDHTFSSSSIVVDQDGAPPVVSSSDEQASIAPNFTVMNEVADEFVKEDVADFYGNMFYNAPQTPEFEVAELSSTYQDPSNMHSPTTSLN
ncbi:hypothetical protein Tco_1184511 [Tanacetum coccineum]